MRTFRHMAAGLVAAVLLCTAASQSGINAQTYPVTTPTYIPDAVLNGAANLTAPGDVYFAANNANTICWQITGTYTGLAAVIQGAPMRVTTATFNTLRMIKRGTGGGPVSSIAANGVYCVNPAGFGYVRFHVTAISTGSVKAQADGSPAATYIDQIAITRTTYSAATVGLVAASSGTDLYTIAGVAGKTIRITRICVSGRATAAASEDVVLVKRSTLDTGGTATVPTDVPNNSGSAAGGAVLAAYTANPTLGTGVGNIGVKQLFLGNLTTGAPGAAACWTWTPGTDNAQEPSLVSATEQIAVNLNGVTNSGNLHEVEIAWTEE